MIATWATHKFPIGKLRLILQQAYLSSSRQSGQDSEEPPLRRCYFVYKGLSK